MSTQAISGRRPKRGEIWLVCFEPQVGAEIRKTRPAVVLSDDSIGVLPLRIVAPVTEWQDAFRKLPWIVHANGDKRNGLEKESGIDAFQVKSISLKRFVRPMGALSADVVDEIAAAVALCVGVSFSHQAAGSPPSA